MTPQIKLLYLLIFFCVVAPLRGFADEENVVAPPKNDEPAETVSSTEAGTDGEPVSKSTVDDPPVPVRTVQIPIFKNGKWKGYREEALEPERKPATDATPTAGDAATTPEAPAVSEPAPPSQ